MKIYTKTILAVVLLVIANSASAVQIHGTIEMGNTGFPSGVSDNLSTLTFSPTINNFQITGATGDFATFISALEVGTIQNIDYNPFIAPTPNLFSFTNTASGGGTTVTFDAISSVFSRTNGFLDLVIYGTLNVTGFDATKGVWAYSDQNGSPSSSWSATASAPAPGIALLMAIGLIGIGVTSKTRKPA